MKRSKRDNYLSIIKRTGYDYIPISFSWCPYLEKTCRESINELGKNMEIPWAPVRGTGELACKPIDINIFRRYFDDLKEGATINIYGIANEPGSSAAMHMTYMRHPMEAFESLSEMKEYPFPEFYSTPEMIEAQLKINNELKKQDYIICGGMQCTIWETSWYMRGMENLMMDMLSDDEKAEYLLDRITDIAVMRAEYFAKTGADVLFLGDDVGMQHTIMMSEQLYCDWLKPRIKRVIDSARKINPQIIIFYHSCGFVTPFISHFAEVGIDVLNPVQPECMDFSKIHSAYGDIMSFDGTIGTQITMAFGSPEDVRREVFKNLKITGNKGGLLPCPTHLLEPEVPWENIKAYIKACYDFTL